MTLLYLFLYLFKQVVPIEDSKRHLAKLATLYVL